MRIQEVLVSLKHASVRVAVKEGKLKVKSKTGPLPDDMKALILEHKAALITFLQEAAIAKAKKSDQAPVAINKADPQHFIPLSHAQHRLWIMNELGADGATYLINMALMLNGPLNVDALKQSFEKLYQRHEILRTVFTLHKSQPCQTIAQDKPLKFVVHHSTETDFRAKMAETANESMDLSTGPLFEIHVFEAKPKSNVHGLLIKIHHIIADGWSMGILVRELTTCYATLSQGSTDVQLPPLNIGYIDYAIWQRSEVSEKNIHKQQSFWMDMLRGSPNLITLPYDRPRPRVQTYAGKVLARVIPQPLNDALQQICKQQATTLYVPMITCFAVMLAKFSSQDDVVIGAPFSGRSHRQLENLIGYFVSTGALRFKPAGNQTLASLFEGAKTMLVNAQANQDVAFEQVVEEFHLQRDPSYSPLFQVMFDLEKGLDAGSEGNDSALKINPIAAEVEVAKFDLTLNVVESNDSLTAYFEYNVDLFDEATIAVMSDYYLTVVKHFVNDSSIRVDAIEVEK
jgi:hypothetical protein